MKTLLIRDADWLVTMDAQRREIAGGSVFIRGPAIEAVGPAAGHPWAVSRTCVLRWPMAVP